jgi:DNA-binding response OmpR family regulator
VVNGSGRPPIVLIVEDEAALRDAVERHLSNQGFSVVSAGTIAGARAAVWEHQPDLLLLDVLLPDGSGYELCAELRTITTAPIIYLTALGQDRAVVRGLEAGGDDYIAKPFSLEVLTARVNAQLRRLGSPRAARIDLPPLHLDFVSGRVSLEGRLIKLSKIELQLLGYFAVHAGIGATQGELLSAVWGDNSGVPTNTVRQHVSSLRRKLDLNAASAFELVHTVDKRYVFQQVRFDALPGRDGRAP